MSDNRTEFNKDSTIEEFADITQYVVPLGTPAAKLKDVLKRNNNRALPPCISIVVTNCEEPALKKQKRA